MICPNCGTEHKFSEEEICPTCGKNLKDIHHNTGKKKSLKYALLASVFVPGLGQAYCGEILRGTLIFLVFIVSLLAIYIYIGPLLAPIVWAVNLFDVYRLVQKINGENF